MAGVVEIEIVARNTIKIAVSDSAKAVVDSTAQELDMSVFGVASRVYEWFGRQDDVIRKGVLGLYPAGLEIDVAKLALERMATPTTGKSDKPAKR